MADTLSKDFQKRMADEIAAEPQGTRDSEMPPSPPLPGGETGPSPGAGTVGPEDNHDTSLTGTGTPDRAIGEEPDPGVFHAGGVNNPDADGVTSATGRD